MREILRSKIHKAIVTEADLNYVGSITIDSELTTRVGLLAGEKVLVSSITTGERLETYVIEGEPGSGIVCINGAASHQIKQGEEIIIMGFEITSNPKSIEPKIILVEMSDGKNRFKKYI